MILSSCELGPGPRGNFRRRGTHFIIQSSWSFVTDEISRPRLLHLAEIVAPKLKTPTTDEEVRFSEVLVGSLIISPKLTIMSRQ